MPAGLRIVWRSHEEEWQDIQQEQLAAAALEWRGRPRDGSPGKVILDDSVFPRATQQDRMSVAVCGLHSSSTGLRVEEAHGDLPTGKAGVQFSS